MALGLGAGVGLGVAAAVTRWPSLLALTQWLRPLGTLFLNLLSMVVIPLVATALFAGVAGLGDLRRVGRLGIRTVAFFWGTTLAAILIGLGVAALLLPFTHITPDQQAALRQAAAADSGAVRHAAEQITTGARFIVELIPSNPVRAAVDGNLLPLIVFVTIFGVAAAALPDEKRHALTDLADVATHALIRIVRWMLLLAPLGIFAIVAGAVAQFGVQLVEIMAVFIVTVIVGLAVLIAAVYLPVVALVARIDPSTYLRAIRASLVMAFSTTSSLATLPVMLEAAESDLRISRTVASFVLPLGASIGRTGSALFQTVAVLFMARLYGVPLGLGGTVQAGVAGVLASVIVPARNEAMNIERCVRSILATEYRPVEVIVVDDRSSDATAEIVERIMRSGEAASRLRLVRGEELPQGWFGKSWAIAQGYRVARGDLLLFTDADTWHHPELLPRTVSVLTAERADLVSVVARQEMVTFWERLVQPHVLVALASRVGELRRDEQDRKSTRLNSSHGYISYAVFCLKKKTDRRSTRLNSSHGYISYAVFCLKKKIVLVSGRSSTSP